MKQYSLAKKVIVTVLALALLLALAACGGQSAPGAEAPKAEGPSDTLRGIYEALIAPDSPYSRNKAMLAEYYPELTYGETLAEDRITLTFQANGNEYFTDGSWDFTEEGDRLNAVIAQEDYSGIINVLYVADAIGAHFGMETELVSGYLNGLSVLDFESDNFRVTEDEAAGTTLYSLNIAGPWDMKELDQMVLTEAVLDDEPLGESFLSQGGSVGKLRYMANGNADSYTVLLCEYGQLDDLAYQSIVNLVTLRRPTGWEAFLADFTALQDLETDGYAVKLDPEEETISEIMGEKSDKFRYVLLRFGTGESGEEEITAYVPEAELFADSYFRDVAAVPQGTAGSSLMLAQSACRVLSFAAGNQLWMADTDTLRENMLRGWESLTDEERANFDASFPALNELINACFEDWDANRGRFDDAGVAEAMEALFEDGTSQWSWDTLSAHTWTLGNDG